MKPNLKVWGTPPPTQCCTIQTGPLRKDVWSINSIKRNWRHWSSSLCESAMLELSVQVLGEYSSVMTVIYPDYHTSPVTDPPAARTTAAVTLNPADSKVERNLKNESACMAFTYTNVHLCFGWNRVNRTTVNPLIHPDHTCDVIWVFAKNKSVLLPRKKKRHLVKHIGPWVVKASCEWYTQHTWEGWVLALYLLKLRSPWS